MTMPRARSPAGPSAGSPSPELEVFRNPEDSMEGRKGAGSSIQRY